MIKKKKKVAQTDLVDPMKCFDSCQLEFHSTVRLWKDKLQFTKKNNKIFVFLLLELLQIMSAMSDSYPSVLSLHILLSAVFPYPGSCTSAKTDSYARPGNLQIN